MGKIELKIGSVVFYNNEQYKIVRIISINEVEIENLVTFDILFVTLNELSSKIINVVDVKTYLDNYSDQEWEEANKRYEIIKDLVFVKRTKNEVEEVGKKYGYSYVTLYEWIKLFEQTNEISSLVSNISKRGKKGSRLDPKVDNVITEVLEDLYLNKQRYSFKRIYNKIYTSCKHQNIIPPHENTLRNRIESLDPKRVVKEREGYKEARKQFDNLKGNFLKEIIHWNLYKLIIHLWI